MSVIRISKYCQSIEAFEMAPRSRAGAPELVLPADADYRVPEDLLEPYAAARR